jgi:Uma2 family endonuclease
MAPITHLSQLDPNGSYTYADYLQWQFDGMVELIKGKIFPMSPAPSMRHQAVSRNVGGLLYQYFKTTPCRMFVAPFDVRLHDRARSAKANQDIYSVVQPDLCVVCDKAQLDEQGCMGAPDWMIEILSPGRNAARDITLKHALYEENGVREYWIVYPNDRLIHQFVPDEAGRYQLLQVWGGDDLAPARPHLFPDLLLPLEDVFAD